ncbi:MAG: DUF481 domain-containing protein [Cocleimonas sp.]|nr:DUF481 domain-containing protein [Cocleimonas sp.]
MTNTAIAANEFISADDEGSKSASELFTNPNTTDKEQGWAVEAEVGFVSAAGSSASSNATFIITATHNKQRLKNTLAADFYFAKSAGEKTAETLSLSHKLGYAINTKSYIFNLLTYHQDKFENIGSRVSDIVGYGRHLIKNKKHSLSNELGFGIQQKKYIDGTKKSKEMAGYFALDYERPLTSNSLLKEKFSILSSKDNTFTKLDTTLEVEMTKKLSLRVNYSVNHNQKVQLGFKKISTKVGVTLVSEF